MSDQHTPNIGEQIKDAVQEGVASGDFSQLNTLVSESVSEALNKIDTEMKNAGVEEAIAQGREHYQKQMQNMQNSWENWNKNQNSGSFSKTPSSRNTSRGGERQVRPDYHNTVQRGQAGQQGQPGQPGAAPRYVRNENATNVRRSFLSVIRKKGNALSVLGEVFGGLGIFWNSFIVLGCLLAEEWIACFFFLVFLAISVAMLVAGIQRHRLLGRASRYAQMAGERKFISIDELVQGTQFDRKKILKDIKKMMQAGIFPQGHLDARETNLMLTDAIYKQYQDAEKGRIQREKEAQAVIPKTREEEKNDELAQMVREGNEAIVKLREMNEAIEGEVISEKLSHLEALLQEIFQKVQEYPDQMPQMHTMMSYYLPTVIKLVEAYKEFDMVSAPGQDIISAKKEIENTIDTINGAFTELLNNLFKDRVFDVTTDAQVLQTMLAREGLSKEGNILEASSAQESAPAMESAPTFESMLNANTSAGPELVLSYGAPEDNK